MKTEQLVSALVADRGRGGWPIGRLIAAGAGAGALVSLAIFFAEFGPRTDLVPAFATWRFDLKLVLVAAALVAAFVACRELARPVAPSGWKKLAVGLLLAGIVALAVEIGSVPPDAWRGRWIGTNSIVCLTTIPLLAIGPLAVLLLVLRRSAPASPAYAGAAAGAFAAAIGAVIYAFHCFDDSPLFVLTWYPLAALPVIVVSALVGQRLLRW